MKLKEIKTKIALNIGGERLTLDIPFSQQDFVRKIEAEMRFKLQEYREKFPAKGQKEHLVMMAYHFATSYFSLQRQHEEEIAEAEDLLREATHLCGADGSNPEDPGLYEPDYEEDGEY